MKISKMKYNLIAVIFSIIAMIISIFNFFSGNHIEILPWVFIWGSLLMNYLGESKRVLELRKKQSSIFTRAMRTNFLLENIKQELQEENPDCKKVLKYTDESMTEIEQCLNEAWDD